MQLQTFGLFNPPMARAMRSNQNGGRFTIVSDTQAEFNRWNGEVVEVADQILTIPVSGMQINNTAELIDADGLDTTAAPSAAGLYYCYLSNELATDFPVELRLSAQAPTDSGTSGQKYLASSGNGANWRLIALFYLVDDGVGNYVFRDSETQRLICHVDNQIPRSLLGRPGYVNDNAQTNVAVANGNYNPLSAATPPPGKVEWITYPASVSVELHLTALVVAGTAGATSQWGIGVDSTTAAVVAAQVASAAVNVSASCSHSFEPAAGYHYALPVASTGLGATWCADTGRHGSAADVPGTVLTGTVWA